MKYLIIGLGNPGEKYENNRHNIGFKVLDKLASLSNISFSTDKLADVSVLKHKGRQLILLKPNTFMNLSGKAVNYWMQKEKVSADNILVVSDDISLPFSTIRLRAKGSDGGHNGLKDIIEVLQSNSFPRIKFGIGSEFNKGRQSDYVLGNWSDEETNLLEERMDLAVKMILSFTTIGINRTMNDFNRR
jgi:PTH1 family peptidyl-tRNA hydrolase